MSALRQRLKQPETWLSVLLLLAAGGALDALRPPENQLTARMYIAAVRAYQSTLRDTRAQWIRCRFQPTCSAYSIQAVQTHGIAQGLSMTIRRLARCRPEVAPGTSDPVHDAPLGVGQENGREADRHSGKHLATPARSGTDEHRTPPAQLFL